MGNFKNNGRLLKFLVGLGICLGLVSIFGFSFHNPNKVVIPDALGTPTAPNGLKTQLFYTTEYDVQISWNDNSNNEEGFGIEYQLDTVGLWNPLATVLANVTTYRQNSVSEGHYYCYRVYAFNVAGNSGFTIPECIYIPKSTPNPPSQLSVQTSGKVDTKVTWKDNSDNEDGFTLEYDMDTSNWQLLVHVLANTTSYVDTGLVPNHTYCYRVFATSTTGNSINSNEACIFIPIPPTQVEPSYWKRLR